MSEKNMPLDCEKEKRTNQKLAIGVGVLGLGAFCALYVVFFLVMIFKPGLIFSMMPENITTTARSDGSRIYILSSKRDNVSFNEKRKPEEKHFLSILEGTNLSTPLEIPRYETANGSNNRLILLNEGKYRSFDGTGWAEVKTDGIGHDPIGTVTPDGLYVMSSFGDTVRLNRIVEKTVTSIPLPDQFLRDRKQAPCPCTQLVWYEGRLCLFWLADNALTWTIWNGSSWLPAATTPFSGGFQVIADGHQLYFFHREGAGTDPARMLSLYVFENNEWAGPTRLRVRSGFIGWDAFIQQGKPMLFVQQSVSQTVYTITNGTLANPVRLEGPLNPKRMMGSLAVLSISMNLAIFLAIYCFSALIRHFKNQHWTQEKRQYEFASLFRRFIAFFLDTLFLIIPPAVVIALFVTVQDFPRDPLRIMLAVAFTLGFYFIGGLLYYSLLEGLFGATLGKKVCGIIVLKADFTRCGLGAGFLRNLMRIVDAFFYYLVAAISMAATLKWQLLGDMVAGTIVVRKN